MTKEIKEIQDLERGDRITRKINISFEGLSGEQTEMYDVVYVNKSDKEALIRFGNLEKIIKEENLKEFNFKKLTKQRFCEKCKKDISNKHHKARFCSDNCRDTTYMSNPENVAKLREAAKKNKNK